MSREITDIDGFETETVPTVTTLVGNSSKGFPSDGDYVTTKGAPATQGDWYFNTTTNRPRYFDGDCFIEVPTTTNGVHSCTHIEGKQDEVDADELDIDFTPNSYLPTTGVPGTDVDHLAAHLRGIDEILAGVPMHAPTHVEGSDEVDFNFSLSVGPATQGQFIFNSGDWLPKNGSAAPACNTTPLEYFDTIGSTGFKSLEFTATFPSPVKKFTAINRPGSCTRGGVGLTPSNFDIDWDASFSVPATGVYTVQDGIDMSIWPGAAGTGGVGFIIDGQYYNGAAWVVSDGSTTGMATSTLNEMNSNPGPPSIVGKTSFQVKIWFNNDTLGQTVSLINFGVVLLETGDRIDGDLVDIDFTPSDYTPSSGTIEGHLSGINTALSNVNLHAVDHIATAGPTVDFLQVIGPSTAGSITFSGADFVTGAAAGGSCGRDSLEHFETVALSALQSLEFTLNAGTPVAAVIAIDRPANCVTGFGPPNPTVFAIQADANDDGFIDSLDGSAMDSGVGSSGGLNLIVDDMWWNGAAWVASDGTSGQSASMLDTETNIGTLASIVGKTSFQIKVWTNWGNGGATQTIQTFNMGLTTSVGADEIDGDNLDIDFTPVNYTPDDSPAEASGVDSLSAHLKGIDDAFGTNNIEGTFNTGTGAFTQPSGTTQTYQIAVLDQDSDYFCMRDLSIWFGTSGGGTLEAKLSLQLINGTGGPVQDAGQRTNVDHQFLNTNKEERTPLHVLGLFNVPNSAPNPGGWIVELQIALTGNRDLEGFFGDNFAIKVSQ